MKSVGLRVVITLTHVIVYNLDGKYLGFPGKLNCDYCYTVYILYN